MSDFHNSMKFKCDPLVRLTCLTTSVATFNDCSCSESNSDEIHISYVTQRQKNEVCNQLSKFAISSFVDLENTCTNNSNDNQYHKNK